MFLRGHLWVSYQGIFFSSFPTYKNQTFTNPDPDEPVSDASLLQDKPQPVIFAPQGKDEHRGIFLVNLHSPLIPARRASTPSTTNWCHGSQPGAGVSEPTEERYISCIYYYYYRKVITADFHLPGTALFAIWAMHTTSLSSPIPKVTYSARRNIAMLPMSDGSTWPGLYRTRPMPNRAPRQL